MRKESLILWLILPALLASSIGNAAHTGKSHLADAKKRYPYNLLGEDFGVLNEQDLASNTCDAIPEPFGKKTFSATPYWQCFEAKEVSFLCDTDVSDDPHEGARSLIVMKIAGKKGNHEYLGRHPFDIKSCQRYRRRFKALSRRVAHICVSGAFHQKTTDDMGAQISYWDFDKYKTRRGCDSYFEGGCDLWYQKKHGCTPVQAPSE
jgi:hypothetical protein